jgi:hypothetical protein
MHPTEQCGYNKHIIGLSQGILCLPRALVYYQLREKIIA